MTQSTMVNTLFLKSGWMEISPKVSSRDSDRGNEDFMDILNERFQAQGNSKAQNSSFGRDRLSDMKSDRPRNDCEIRKPEGNRPSAAAQAKPAKNADAGKTVEANEVPAEKNSDSDKDRETIASLEAIIAMLEELLARLDVKTVSAEPTETSDDPQKINVTQGVSIMDILKALIEGNREKIEALLAKVEEAQPTEFKEIVDDIRKLLDDTAKAVGAELNLEIDESRVSNEELLIQLKAQCGDIIEKLKEKISDLKARISEPVNDEALELGTQTDQMQPVEEAPEGSDAKEYTSSRETGEKIAKAYHKHQPASQKTSSPEEEKTVQKDSISAEGFAVTLGQKTQQPADVKFAKPFPLSEKPLAQTVTNQVMMKVKLMAGENKQEMEMHLKPESLGKLSLKIIHERGEILAKITAENEQVKSILESNMQLLKDSLEKSGLSVQSLSVSVGNGENEAKQNPEKNGSSAPRNNIGASRNLSDSEARHETRFDRSYYDDSRINLTA